MPLRWSRKSEELVPPGATVEFHVTARVVTEVELAVKPESVALGGFGGIAALVCLVLGAQAVSRQVRWGDDDRRAMRALGAAPSVTAADGLIGILGAVAVGSVVAIGVAVGLSPLSPLAPVRSVYPDGGFAFDWTVFGIGLVVLLGVLGAGAVVLSYLGTPHRAPRVAAPTSRSSVIARRAESAGMPVAGVVGIRFALEPGRGRTAVPVRSALVGTVVAVALVVSTLTFASSLNTLVSHPALYGSELGLRPQSLQRCTAAALELLGHDHDVAGWSGFDYNDVAIDDQTVPVLMAPRQPK